MSGGQASGDKLENSRSAYLLSPYIRGYIGFPPPDFSRSFSSIVRETRRVTRLIRSHSRFQIRQGRKGVRRRGEKRREEEREKGLAALAERKFITTLSRPLERCSLIFYQRRPSLFSLPSLPPALIGPSTSLAPVFFLFSNPFSSSRISIE